MFQSQQLTTSSLGSAPLMFPQRETVVRKKREPSIMRNETTAGSGGASGTISFKDCATPAGDILSIQITDGLITSLSVNNAEIRIKDCSSGS